MKKGLKLLVFVCVVISLSTIFSAASCIVITSQYTIEVRNISENFIPRYFYLSVNGSEQTPSIPYAHTGYLNVESGDVIQLYYYNGPKVYYLFPQNSYLNHLSVLSDIVIVWDGTVVVTDARED